jgi:hypothetical protein
MPLLQPKPLPPPFVSPFAKIDQGTQTLSLTQPWVEYFSSIDSIIRLLAAARFNSLVNAANDGAAAAAGVQIGGLYRNVNAVQIRLV